MTESTKTKRKPNPKPKLRLPRRPPGLAYLSDPEVYAEVALVARRLGSYPGALHALVADRVAAMYSEEFVRIWRLYLAGSSAGFQSGTLQLYQVLFAPGASSRVPWTRTYQYANDGASH